MNRPNLKNRAHDRQDRVAVWRITVDEKLSEDYIRLLVSPLDSGVKDFSDEKDNWGRETIMFVQSENYAQIMKIPAKFSKKILWSDLWEGQVFLAGRFRIVGNKKTPVKFRVDSKQQNFLSIYELAKKQMKRIYFRTLEGKSDVPS